MTSSADLADATFGPLRPVGRPKQLFRGTAAALRELASSRELINRLVAKEIKARYKDSYLGIVWSLMRPIVQLAIYYIFIGQVLGAARSIPDFAVFIFANLVLWTLLHDTISNGTTSIVTNGGLVKKIYLPREIFPLTALGSASFNFLIQFAVLLIATAIFGVFPVHWELLYALPAVAIVAVWGLAFGMAFAAINVYLRDTEHLVEIGLMLFFWASPILYSLSFAHNALGGTFLESLYLSNPPTIALVAMQKATWISGAADPTQYWPPDLDLRLLITFLVGLLALWISQRLFARLQGNFAQEL
jgi:ABC-2 type transport system permease protein